MPGRNRLASEGKFLRDGRAPPPKSIVTSKVMSANKGKNTGPELSLRKALWSAGIKGYRVHLKNLPGRPDIVFSKKKIAIFVHGCFWHQCPICMAKTPRTHEEFWKAKFARNAERDEKVLIDLRTLGWTTMVVWECEVRKDVGSIVNRIKQCLEGTDE
jgi:DNA mismatch endonuclease, patch repair protein